jgi:AraC-like DNA-binding protein
MSRKRHTPADETHFLVRTLAAEFADGRELAPHAHSWGQLIYVASGVASVWTSQGSWVAPPHWAVWAPAGVAHGMRFTGTASMRTLYLRPGLVQPDLAQTSLAEAGVVQSGLARIAGLGPNSAVVPVSPLLRELILRAVEIGMLDDREPAHVAMAALIVHELRSHPAPSLDLPLPHGDLLRRIADHVTRKPADPRGHAALAKQFGIGARTLERGFAAETGLSFGRWRRQARFLHALRCLGAGAAVKRAAVEAGYQSPSAFIAAFHATFNTTPGRYFEAGRSVAERSAPPGNGRARVSRRPWSAVLKNRPARRVDI